MLSRAEYNDGAIMEDISIDSHTWYEEYKADPLCAVFLIIDGCSEP